MIPKVIHYCWFGGNPLPSDAKKCIESWKKHCPDYEIKEWNEINFDFASCEYAKEAYEAKKWAFVSDYARFYILYNEGGLYFDTDVEMVKSITPIVEKGSFMGLENDIDYSANPGLGLAAAPGLGLYKEILDYYNTIHFINPDGSYNYKTIVEYTTEILRKHGLQEVSGIQNVDGILIYPKEFFNPMDMNSREIKATENTFTIHHYAASWVDKYSRFRGKVYQKITSIFGDSFAKKVRKFVGRK